MKTFLLLICVLFLSGCVTLKRCNEKYPPIIKDSISTQYVQVKHDSVIYLQDEASLKALLFCDSLGNVRIKQIEQFRAGQFVKPSIQIRDNYITAECKIDSGKVAISWNTTHITTDKVKTVTVQVPQKLSWWKSTMVIGGYVFMGMIILLIVYIVLKVLKLITF